MEGCAVFRTQVDDQARVLRTSRFDRVWDLDLYEFDLVGPVDSLEHHRELDKEAGRYYSFADRVRWAMIEHHLDSLRIRAIPNVDDWYKYERPRLSDPLYSKYPCSYHRFEGEIFLTGDTIWQWLGNSATLETSDSTFTLAQILKLEHEYLFVFDSDGPTHSLGRGHYVERRVSFYIDSSGKVRNWRSTRERIRKMRIV